MGVGEGGVGGGVEGRGWEGEWGSRGEDWVGRVNGARCERGFQ